MEYDYAELLKFGKFIIKSIGVLIILIAIFFLIFVAVVIASTYLSIPWNTKTSGDIAGYVSLALMVVSVLAYFLGRYAEKESLKKKKIDELKKRELKTAGDSLYKEAKDFIIQQGSVNTKQLREKLDIGYERALAIMQELEKQEYVGAPEGKDDMREVNTARLYIIERKIDSGGQDVSYIGETLEKTLDSYGISIRLIEAFRRPQGVEYCFEIKSGTKFEDIENRVREIALSVASPTGKVEIIAPIPGYALIGIVVPCAKKYYMDTFASFRGHLNLRSNTESASAIKDLRYYASMIFMIIALVFAYIGDRISGRNSLLSRDSKKEEDPSKKDKK